MLKRLFKNTSAATTIEYTFIALLIAIACMLSIRALGVSMKDSYSDSATQVEGATNNALATR